MRVRGYLQPREDGDARVHRPGFYRRPCAARATTEPTPTLLRGTLCAIRARAPRLSRGVVRTRLVARGGHARARGAQDPRPQNVLCWRPAQTRPVPPRSPPDRAPPVGANIAVALTGVSPRPPPRRCSARARGGVPRTHGRCADASPGPRQRARRAARSRGLLAAHARLAPAAGGAPVSAVGARARRRWRGQRAAGAARGSSTPEARKRRGRERGASGRETRGGEGDDEGASGARGKTRRPGPRTPGAAGTCSAHSRRRASRSRTTPSAAGDALRSPRRW